MGLKIPEPALHNPELHKLVFSYLAGRPKGHLLDIPSGPGYLLRELKKIGFDGIAAEIDPVLHYFKDVNYKKVDMSLNFPFEDNYFDYIVSIEGIEHIENQFSFIREVSRVLKTGGEFIITTPNVHSLESRFKFFLSGFHSLAAKPIPHDTKNIYFEHINPIDLHYMYFILKRSGFDIKLLTCPKCRKGSLVLYRLLYPFICLSTYISCFSKSERNRNKELFKLLISKQNLAGSHTVIIATKK
ncbi:MAG: class I SAM-dependent methyltransferase [bacterium]